MSPFFAALFGSVVGPFITRLLDTYFGNAKRTELERDSLAQSICVEIDKLLDECTLFWGQSAEDIGSQLIALRATIFARVQSINMMQNELFNADPAKLKLTREEWRALHRSATGGNVDDDDRPADGGRLRAILQDGFQLKHGVQKCRSQMSRSRLSG
jgi:hypothetical protein